MLSERRSDRVEVAPELLGHLAAQFVEAHAREHRFPHRQRRDARNDAHRVQVGAALDLDAVVGVGPVRDAPLAVTIEARDRIACLLHRLEVKRLHHAEARTLRRRLAAEGVSFRALRDEALRERAVELLRRPGSAIAEVAFVLGFSDPTAFHRAFRRWTGVTPQAWRRGEAP